MSDKSPVTPEEQQEKNPTWLGYHAQLVGQKMVDAARFLGQVFHTELQQDYRSRLLQFDQSGKLVVETKPSTMTVILNIPGGKLDGLTVQIGDIQFTYPSNNILTDSFSLPSPGLRVMISGGNTGDNIAVVESKLPWNQLNRASGAITVGQGSTPWLTQLTGSNATIGSTFHGTVINNIYGTYDHALMQFTASASFSLAASTTYYGPGTDMSGCENAACAFRVSGTSPNYSVYLFNGVPGQFQGGGVNTINYTGNIGIISMGLQGWPTVSTNITNNSTTNSLIIENLVVTGG